MRPSLGEPSSFYAQESADSLQLCLYLTDRLLRPNVLLHNSLQPLVLGAHVRACSYWCDRFGESSGLFGVGEEASFDRVFALIFASSLELFK